MAFRLTASLILMLALGLIHNSAQTARADTITVFAAASLTSVITEAANKFETETGVKSRLSFASSSALARQIEAGAQADLYLSANTKWMDYLEERGLIDPERQFRELSNQLVLVAPSDTDLSPIEQLTRREIELALGPNGLMTLGDPDHVPAGIYAKLALQKLGLWEGVQKRIARADHARAALALVEKGETPLGIVYQTDAALISSVKILYVFDSADSPIRYALALTNQSEAPAASTFFDYLVSEHGLAMFEKHGFVNLSE